MNYAALNPSILTLVTFLPLAGAVLLCFFRAATAISAGSRLSFRLATSGLAAPARAFRPAGPRLPVRDRQALDRHAATFTIHLGIDGISLWLVLLTTFLMPLCVLISWKSIHDRVKEFFILLLVLETAMIGVFVALDLFLFYFFWEATLIPMALLIGMYGHERRVYAAVKFFLYTMIASVFMLAAIIWLYARTGTFDFVALQHLIRSGQVPGSAAPRSGCSWRSSSPLPSRCRCSRCTPGCRTRTWKLRPPGSVLLAGVLLKMGTYGLLRFNLGLFPEQARRNAPWIIALAIIGIIYGALVAMVQPNMKKLVAYSSVSHLGFVVLGIFSFTQVGMDGAVYQMLNHGISTGALFLLLGMIYDRRHTYEITEYGGLATPMPVYATFFLFIMLASVGLPLLNGFVGEFLVLSGAFQAKALYGILAASGVIWSACYMLWMYQRVFYGKVTNPVNASLPDLIARERARCGRWPCRAGHGRAPLLWLTSPSIRPCSAVAFAAANATRDADDRALTMIPATGDYIRILPELVLAVFGMPVMVVEPLLPRARQPQAARRACRCSVAWPPLAATFFMAGASRLCLQRHGAGRQLQHLLSRGGACRDLAGHPDLVRIPGGAADPPRRILRPDPVRRGRHGLMSSAVELVLIFIALEISSIASYILAGFRRHAAESAEASLKYFLLGSFATAFFLYGVALMFGATGSTNIYEIGAALRHAAPPTWLFAVALMFVGLGFKVASAPFHVWTPDVYEGAPAPVVALMSTAPKAAAFAVLLRMLFATGGNFAALVLAGLGRGRAFHDAGQPRRAGADQREAPAGLLLHRPRRLPAGCLRRPRP